MGALGNIFYCLTNDHRLVNKYALKFMYKPNSLSCTQNSNANGYLNCWDNTKHSWGTTPNLLFAESYANVCPMHTWMVSVANLQCRFYWRVTPRRVLPYLGMVDRFCSDDPPFFFFFFYPIGSLFYALSRSDWPHISAETISLSLSDLVPEILGHKFGLIFHKILLFILFNRF